MPQFLTYIPTDKQSPTPEVIEGAGLSRVVLGQHLEHGRLGAGAGPDGKTGVVFVDWPTGSRPESEQMRVGYYKDAQKWWKCADGAFWLGVYTDRPMPGPDDLARPKQLGGHLVELGDGNEWIVPAATAVPSRRVLTPEGAEAREPVSGYEQFSEMAGDFYRAWYEWLSKIDSTDDEETPPAFEYARETTDALLYEALAVNYRVTEWHVLALGLLTDTTEQDVMLATIDWPRRQRILTALADAEKKTESVDTPTGPTTGSGETDSVPPPTETSPSTPNSGGD